MTTRALGNEQIREAEEVWQEYQRTHDLAGDEGRTAGIDPATRGVWIGDSIADVVDQRTKAGVDSPLVFKRIGSATYYRKGRRR